MNKSIEQAFASVKGSIAVEGIFLTKAEEELVLQKVKGEISQEEFLEKAYNLAKNS